MTIKSSDIFTEMKDFKINHPIKSWIHDSYHSLKRLPGNIHSFISTFIQRGRYGIAISDTWELYGYIAKITHRGLLEIKNYGYGLPTWNEGMTELDAQNEWSIALNTMINTFSIAMDIEQGDIFYIPTTEWTTSKFKKSIKMLEDNCRVLNLEEAKEFELGFDYLKKYFFSLGD